MLNEYVKYLNPKTIYLPLTDNEAKLASIKVAKGDKVAIGTLLAEKYFGKIKYPVLSTVSGKVKGFEERLDRFGNLVNHVVIENDGKDTHDSSITALVEADDSSKIKEKLETLGVNNLDMDPLFTGIRYDNVKDLYICAIYPNEPLIKTDYKYLGEHAAQVIKGCNYLSKATNANKTYLLVSSHIKKETFENLMKENDGSLQIVKVATHNPAYAYKAVKKYSKIALQANHYQGIVLVGVATALAANAAIKDGMPPITKMVTLTGSGLESNQACLVRIGTPLEDLLKECGGTKDSKFVLTLGKILNGIPATSSEVVVTKELNTVNVTSLLCDKETDCNKCGLCNDVCPVGILPQAFIQANFLGDAEKIKALGVDKCIECGRCSYVCPNNVEVLETMRRSKRRSM